MKLKAETLSKMSCLEILRFDSMRILGNLSGLSNQLRYLKWHNYPYTNLPHPFTHSPSMFQVDRLVELFMPYCNSKQLWEGRKVMSSLFVFLYFLIKQSKAKKNYMTNKKLHHLLQAGTIIT